MHQREKIKKLFEERPDTWIPLHEFLEIAAQYGARILELRRRGMNIENKTRHLEGRTLSWFRWVQLIEDKKGQFEYENLLR